MDEYISQKELASKLKVTRKTLIQWDKKGLLPKIKIGNTVRYNLTEMEKMFKSKQNK